MIDAGGERARATALRVDAPFPLRRPCPRAELMSFDTSYTPPQSVAFLRVDAVRDHLKRLRERP
jgi:hypothetical protein